MNPSVKNDAEILRSLAKMLEQGIQIKFMLHYQSIMDGVMSSNFVSNISNTDEAVGVLARLQQNLVERSQQGVSQKVN